MRCSQCNEKIAVHDLWCTKCGKRTEVLSSNLSAIDSLRSSWEKYKSVKGKNLPVGIIAALTGIIPLMILVILLNFTIPVLPQWQFLLIHILVWLFFVPTLFVPFREVCRKDNYDLSIKGYLISFKSYFTYLFFVFLSVLFYTSIFFICKGDPILNLVWLVLILYWLAIVIPVPILMERYNIQALKAVKLSYLYAGDLRWNIFLMMIILSVMNILAAILAFIGLAVSIPFTWFAIRDYIDRMIDFEIFD